MFSGASGPVLARSCALFVQYTVPYAVTTLIVPSAYCVVPGGDASGSARMVASFSKIGRSASDAWLFFGAGAENSSSLPICRAESSKVWIWIVRDVALGIGGGSGVGCFSTVAPATGAISAGGCAIGMEGRGRAITMRWPPRASPACRTIAGANSAAVFEALGMGVGDRVTSNTGAGNSGVGGSDGVFRT